MKNFRSSSQAGHRQAQTIQHSVLAMRAAKRMSSSKQKSKVGRTICHHLLQMISETDNRQPDPRASRRYHRSAVGRKVVGQLLSPLEASDLFGADLFSQSVFSQSVFSPSMSSQSSYERQNALYAKEDSVQAISQAANDRQFSLSF